MTTKFQVGKTYKTRDGKDVRIIATDRVSKVGYTIVGLIEPSKKYATNAETLATFTAEGRSSNCSLTDDDDLVTTEERWLNLLSLSASHQFATRHDSKEAAARLVRPGSSPKTLAQVKITYTDGEPTGVELVPVAE